MLYPDFNFTIIKVTFGCKSHFMLKAVIVDDEPKAIKSLLWELSNFNDDLEIIQTFTEADKAIKYINENTIDCLF